MAGARTARPTRSFPGFDAVAGLVEIGIAFEAAGSSAVYLDTLITVYDSTGSQVARNHDAADAYFSGGSRLCLVIPADGTYFIKVEEWCATTEGRATAGCGGDYFAAITETGYNLGIGFVDPADEGITAEAAEPNDTAGTATIMDHAFSTFLGYVSIAYGLWGTSGDVDLIRFEIPGDVIADPGTRAHASFMFPPQGAMGNGGTTKTGIVEIRDIASGDVLGRLDYADESEVWSERVILSVPVVAFGEYLLTIQGGPAAVGGIAPSYVVWHTVTASGNPLEAQEVANNSISTPETLVSSGDSYFVEGDLLTADLDHFRVGVLGSGSLSVRCGGASVGSGATLRATAYSADGGTPLGALTETPPPNGSLILDVDASGQTSVIVKLEKTAQSAQIDGGWYRCGFHFIP